MNDLPRNLRSKRSPGGKLRELCAGVAERLCTRLLLGDHVGSTPTACTMGLVVVRTAHPCGGQQVRTRAWPSGEATVLHTVNGSSILSARTSRMPGAAREARQLSHAGAARMEERLFHTQKAVGSIPTTGTVRRRRSVMVAFLSRRSSMEELAISTRTDAGSSPVVGSGHRRRHVSLSPAQLDGRAGVSYTQGCRFDPDRRDEDMRTEELFPRRSLVDKRSPYKGRDVGSIPAAETESDADGGRGRPDGLITHKAPFNSAIRFQRTLK
jgi:hypothetical protein